MKMIEYKGYIIHAVFDDYVMVKQKQNNYLVVVYICDSITLAKLYVDTERNEL